MIGADVTSIFVYLGWSLDNTICYQLDVTHGNGTEGRHVWKQDTYYYVYQGKLCKFLHIIFATLYTFLYLVC